MSSSSNELLLQRNKENKNLVKIEKIKISFDGLVAVNNISFTVQAGQVVGILGSNGAGKSSTMKALAGVIPIESGSIKIDGYELTSLKEGEKAKKNIGYCPDVGGVVTGSTPREHIKLLLNLHHRKEDYQLGLSLVTRIGLEEFLDTPVGGFSHGMTRRLSVVLATLASQKVLILDEPFDGVDPLGVDAIETIIQEAKKNNMAVIVCTHLQSILTRIVDNVFIMKKGNIVGYYSAEELSGTEGEKIYKNILSSPNEEEFAEKMDEETSVMEETLEEKKGK